jgi:regulation of enolase protein 1 (concanavalin A-like superfamily)
MKFCGRFIIILNLCVTALGTEEVLFKDDFKEKLGPGWSWLRENPKAWRATGHGLEVLIEPGNMWGPQNNASNVLLRAAPDPAAGELAISVTVENKPSSQYEQVDLVWYYDDGHMVKLGQELVDGKLSVVMGREEQDRTRTIAIVPLDSNTVQLQLVVKGKQIRGRFRTAAAKEWREAGECDLPAPAAAKPRLSLQFYQGPPDAEHWARATDFLVRRIE